MFKKIVVIAVLVALIVGVVIFSGFTTAENEIPFEGGSIRVEALAEVQDGTTLRLIDFAQQFPLLPQSIASWDVSLFQAVSYTLIAETGSEITSLRILTSAVVVSATLVGRLPGGGDAMCNQLTTVTTGRLTPIADIGPNSSEEFFSMRVTKARIVDVVGTEIDRTECQPDTVIVEFRLDVEYSIDDGETLKDSLFYPVFDLQWDIIRI